MPCKAIGPCRVKHGTNGLILVFVLAPDMRTGWVKEPVEAVAVAALLIMVAQ